MTGSLARRLGKLEQNGAVTRPVEFFTWHGPADDLALEAAQARSAASNGILFVTYYEPIPAHMATSQQEICKNG